MADVIGVAEINVWRQGRSLAAVGSQLAYHRADRRPVRTQEARIKLRRGVPFLLELHVADDGELVGDPGVERQHLGNADAGHHGVDRLEFAAIFDRGIRLRVVEVDVRRAAVQVNEDDGLIARTRPLGSLQAQHVRQGERPDAEEESAGNHDETQAGSTGGSTSGKPSYHGPTCDASALLELDRIGVSSWKVGGFYPRSRSSRIHRS